MNVQHEVSSPRRRRLLGLVLGLAAAGLGATTVAAQLPAADVVISGGTVYDGSGAAAMPEDVVVIGDRIAYVGPDAATRFAARRVIDARGMIVTPGFIDAHTHPETYIRSADAKQRLNAPWLFQGVSTVMIGIDGWGTPDIAAEAAWFKAHAVGTNLAAYVGFGPVREQVLGMAARAPTDAELQRMQGLVANAMCAGAFGLSTGLFYAPQSFSKTGEVVALAREAARRGGIYDTHQRDESSYSIGVIASTREVIEIGREARLPVHIAHIKALGVDVHGQSRELVALIDQARSTGQDVTADLYPWLASQTSLDASLVPPWAHAGGRAEMLRRFAQPATLDKIEAAMRENLRRRGGAQTMLLTDTGHPWSGKTLEQVARGWKVDPIEAAVRLMRENAEVVVASFNMDDADVRRFMQQPWVITSSDGGDGHPRQYATFPEEYVKYVQQAKVITLADFIHRSTGRSADILGLRERGYLRQGYYADVLVFDPQRFAPKADYVHPKVLSVGVVQLLVNGKLVVDGGQLTNTAPGRFLLHAPTAGTCP